MILDEATCQLNPAKRAFVRDANQPTSVLRIATRSAMREPDALDRCLSITHHASRITAAQGRCCCAQTASRDRVEAMPLGGYLGLLIQLLVLGLQCQEERVEVKIVLLHRGLRPLTLEAARNHSTSLLRDQQQTPCLHPSKQRAPQRPRRRSHVGMRHQQRCASQHARQLASPRLPWTANPHPPTPVPPQVDSRAARMVRYRYAAPNANTASRFGEWPHGDNVNSLVDISHLHLLPATRSQHRLTVGWLTFCAKERTDERPTGT